MNDRFSRSRRTWPRKFRDAFRGVKEGIRNEASFFVHLFFAAAVLVAGAVLGSAPEQWCAVVLSIGGVLAAEMFNTALETLARAITDRYDPAIRNALDIGSAAVLLAAATAVTVGAITFAPRFADLLGW